MTTDVVFPKNNELALIATAEKLGWKKLVLLYPSAHFKQAQKQFDATITLELAEYITKQKQASHMLFAPEKRSFFEDKSTTAIILSDEPGRKDATHFRRTELNQVLCKLAAAKNKVLVINFSELLRSPNQPQLLGRLMQTVRLCRKYKVKVVLCSCATTPLEMRSPSDMKALGAVLGMSSAQIKELLEQF